MSAVFIMVLVAIFIFIVYNSIVIYKFGIPRTLSNSFYLWNNVHNNLGYVFTAMMFSVVVLLLPCWFQVTENVSEWSRYLTVLPFLCASGIAFVGAAPAFRSCKMESTVHETSAKIAAVFGLLWCFVVCYKICYVVPAVVLLMIGLGFATKSWKSAKVYWLEMMAFVSVFVCLIVECIMCM